MQRILGYFLFCFVFIFGMSIGTYMGINKNLINMNDMKKDITETEKEIIPVQDVVIRNVQEEKKQEMNVIETVVEETKLSPYAKMTIEKKFTKCGHTTIETVDIPLELINMTEREIMEKYENWEIRSFNSKEVSLFREIVANCNDHFVLKEKDGYIAIYSKITEDKMNLKEITDIDVRSLPSGDVKNLEEGIYVYGKDALSGIIEDFNS